MITTVVCAAIAGGVGYYLGKKDEKALGTMRLRGVCDKLEEVGFSLGYYRGLCVNTVRFFGGNGGLLEMYTDREEFGEVYLTYVAQCVKEVVELKKGKAE